MWDEGWTIVSAGVFLTSNHIVTYWISCFDDGDETLPLAA